MCGAPLPQALGPKASLKRRSPVPLAAATVLIFVSTACTPDPAAPSDLTDPTLWAPTSADDDPYAEERPTDLSCPEGSYGPEGTIFEVETDLCNYGSFSQPLLGPTSPGDRIEGVLWHLQLWAAEEAEAHFVVQIGDTILLEERIPVPSEEAIYPIEWTASEALETGVPVRFHVHNHGTNSWRLGTLSRSTP